MSTLTEGQHAGEFVVSEANGSRSREPATVVTGQNLKAGHVVGTVTASGKLTEWNPANLDGSETVSGILFDNVDATAADASGVVFARDAEVQASALQYFDGATQGDRDTAAAQLSALGIIVR